MHICIFMHQKMEDKEGKWTLINEYVQYALTFEPPRGRGGVGEETQDEV